MTDGLSEGHEHRQHSGIPTSSFAEHLRHTIVILSSNCNRLLSEEMYWGVLVMHPLPLHNGKFFIRCANIFQVKGFSTGPGVTPATSQHIKGRDL